jgi:hypothetical protein
MRVHDKLLSVDTGRCTQSHYQLIFVKTYQNSYIKDTYKQVRQIKNVNYF